MLPDWKDYQTEDVKATRMTGITNETYKIEHPSVDQALLFREFGDADDSTMFVIVRYLYKSRI